LPPLFIENPDAMDAFKKYGVDNLKDLSVEMMHTYVLETLVPKMMARLESTESDEEEGGHGLVSSEPQSSEKTKVFLKSYGMDKVSMTTVLNWMNVVGFRYTNRSKHYFLDGHEKLDTLAYRPVFTKRYLAHEVQSHQWIQLTVVASNKLEAQGLVAKGIGYSYLDPTENVDIVEYHVDGIPSERLATLALGPFGAYLSVKRDVNKPTIVMFIGQDEAIYKQFLFLSKMWTGPKGERALLPKDEGAGVMISSFIDREYVLIQKLEQHAYAGFGE
jgi:hypothetical protein